MAVIKFGEWTPDLPDYENSGLVDIINVRPGSGGYRPFLGAITAGSNTITTTCKGVISFIDDINASRTYVGTDTKIFGLEALSHTDYSRTAGYNTREEDFWEFEKFGSQIVATNGSDPMQSMEIGATLFQDVSGAPVAKHIAVVKDFIVTGNTDSIASRVHWSAYNDISFPTPGTVTADAVQSGRQIIKGSGGPVQGIAGGQTGIVFQENAISTMRYVGGSVVFQIETLANVKGLLSPNGWVKAGNIVYFVSRDGFYAHDGTQPVPIGENKVNNFFIADLNHTHAHRIQATADPNDNVVIFNYPNTSSSGAPNRQLIYNYATQQWTKVHDSNLWMFAAYGRGITLDDMDTEVTSDLDTVPLSLDSSVYNRGKAVLSGYDASHRLMDYSGTALTATFLTAELAPYGLNRTIMESITPIIECSSVAAEVGTRDVQTTSATFEASSTVNTVGVCTSKAEGRYISVRFTAHDLTLAFGYDMEHFPGGRY